MTLQYECQMNHGMLAHKDTTELLHVCSESATNAEHNLVRHCPNEQKNQQLAVKQRPSQLKIDCFLLCSDQLNVTKLTTVQSSFLLIFC